MKKNSVLDFLGVARSIALAATCTGLLTLVAVFLLALAGVGVWSTAVPSSGLGLLVLGVIVILVTTLSRVLVARMKFHSPEP